MGPYSQPRKNLFENEKIELDLFNAALNHAVNRAKDDDITELTDHMDKQQKFETGFKHMVQRMKELQE